MHSGDIRPGELRQVLRQLDDEDNDYAIRAVVEATGAEPARVARALVGVRVTARAKLATIAVLLLVGATLVAVVGANSWPGEPDTSQSRSLQPARIR